MKYTRRVMWRARLRLEVFSTARSVEAESLKIGVGSAWSMPIMARWSRKKTEWDAADEPEKTSESCAVMAAECWRNERAQKAVPPNMWRMPDTLRSAVRRSPSMTMWPPGVRGTFLLGL